MPTTPRRSPRRSAALATGLAIILAVFTCAVAAPGAGAVSLVRCAGTESATYSPGLTNTPAPTTVTVNDVLSPCVSALPLWTGSATTSLTIPSASESCDQLLRGGPGSLSVRWSDATTSTFSYNRIVNRVRGEIVVSKTGTISAGRYLGSTALGVVVQPGDLTACSTPGGLTSSTGTYTFDIVI